MLPLLAAHTVPGGGHSRQAENASYLAHARQCLDLLLEHGTDRYGESHTPVLVSILDLETLECPAEPMELDAYFRVTRPARRNPAGSNLFTDQPSLKSMYLLSAMTGEQEYAAFADRYAAFVMGSLTDEKGFFWWGLHRHYDVYRDVRDGHNGDHHEIQAIHSVLWQRLWTVDSVAVTGEIQAIWDFHVIDKETGEVNRHGDGRRGCDFSMSGGAYIEAFAFLYRKTNDPVWLNRALLIADYYWDRRNPETDLFPDRPNAGTDRFDGYSFVTSITGLHCHSLLRAWETTRVERFRDYALAYLKAYAKYGYDETAGKFWGALRMDGTPIPGPRVYADNVDSPEGYEANQPRGHLDLWEPYVAGYQYAIYTAQAYAYAFHLTGDPAMLTAARRFAEWIRETPPGSPEMEDTWYRAYAEGPGREGTYAGKYGRTISFLLHLFVVTGEEPFLDDARSLADESIEKLEHKGLLRGHPSKPYYEAMDGVGYLLYSLLELDHVLRDPESVVNRERIFVGKGHARTVLGLDNW